MKKNIERQKNPNNSELPARSVNISSFVMTPKKIAMALTVLLVITAITYLVFEVGSFTDAPRLVVLSPQPNAEVGEASVYVEGVTDKDAKLFLNDQPILVGDDGKFRQTLAIRSGVNDIHLKAVNRFEKASEAEISVRGTFEEKAATAEDKNDGSPDGQEGAGQEKPVRLEIWVEPGPVWLSVKADDQLVFSGTMLSGPSQVFEADGKITVSSGSGKATFVKLNGQDKDALGVDAGPVKDVVFSSGQNQ